MLEDGTRDFLATDPVKHCGLYITRPEKKGQRTGRRQPYREYYRTADADRSPVASGASQPCRDAGAFRVASQAKNSPSALPPGPWEMGRMSMSQQ